MKSATLALALTLAACGPDARPACEEVHAAMQRASDAAETGDYDAFLVAYDEALPLFGPVRDALYDAGKLDREDIGYPMTAAGEAWMLHHSVVGLLASRTVADSSGQALFTQSIEQRVPALDSTLAATAVECESL